MPGLFCWWDWSSHRRFKPGEFEGAVRHFRRFYEDNGPFDVCFGFSQGAAMAVLLLALLEAPDLHPAWLEGPRQPGVEWPPQPFKCAVLCSAFGPGDPDYVAWFKKRRPTTPTLHIIGKNDVVADPQHSLDTVARFADARVVWHNGGALLVAWLVPSVVETEVDDPSLLAGHHIPRKPFYAQLMKDFMLSSCDSHDWIDMPERDGWGSPTESVASSAGGNVPLTGFFEDVAHESRL